MVWRAGMQEAGVGGGCVYGYPDCGWGGGVGYATSNVLLCLLHSRPLPPCPPPPLLCRLEELEEIGQEWRALQVAAHELDRRLRQTPWRTLCHGKHCWVALCVADAQLRCRTTAGGHNWHPHRSACLRPPCSPSCVCPGLPAGCPVSSPFWLTRPAPAGDFKSANLQFSDGRSAPVCAAVDFQYCGGGSGLKDVVYLLASAASPRLLQVGHLGAGSRAGHGQGWLGSTASYPPQAFWIAVAILPINMDTMVGSAAR